MKKHISFLLAACMGLSAVLSGCGGAGQGAQSTAAVQETAAETQASEGETSAASEQTAAADATVADASADGKAADGAAIRVGSLKGPTSMGLVHLMDQAEKGETSEKYEFTMAGKADELVGKTASGDLDIVLVPANVASALYNKTQGKVTVLDINTLGVLYVVASDESISSMADLKGKTIYMTGKGTTPEYAVNYLLSENGMETGDVDLQFKSEATEVVSFLKENPDAIGILPQPFATAACIQNDTLKPVLDLTKEWNRVSGETGSMLVTGVTIVRNDFLTEHEEAVKAFIKAHEESAAFTNEQPAQAAELIAAQGIVEKAPIAEKAIPKCNIVCITGEEMKNALSGYLSVLYSQDAKSVGGNLPGDDFYYLP